MAISDFEYYARGGDQFVCALNGLVAIGRCRIGDVYDTAVYKNGDSYGRAVTALHGFSIGESRQRLLEFMRSYDHG